MKGKFSELTQGFFWMRHGKFKWRDCAWGVVLMIGLYLALIVACNMPCT